MIFKKQAEKDFNIDAISIPEMEKIIQKCADIYRGNPEWVNAEDNVKTVNFAKSVCSEVAKLTTLAIGIQIEGSARAKWIQEQIDQSYFLLRNWVEYGCAYGTVFIKPNGESLDIFTPEDVLLIDYDNRGIKGIVFKDAYTEGKTYYTRLEYHRFIERKDEAGNIIHPYMISNRAYSSKSSKNLGDPIPLKRTKWADLAEETGEILKSNGESLDGPMFGVFRTPQANNINISVPLGLPIFAEAIEELKDLDVAYSRNAGEIFDSEKIVLLDDQLLDFNPSQMQQSNQKLPHYVKNVFSKGTETFYQEINPNLNTDIRLNGINSLLSQMGYKIGFSNGYFVFNEQTGMVTATQVESDDRRTIQLIKDVRDKLESCLNELIYAISVYADLYNLAPVGEYEVVYDFGDITYNREEDRLRWWQYVVQGKVPAWRYFVKFEGMTEEDAKEMIEEAKPKEEPGLFEEE